MIASHTSHDEEGSTTLIGPIIPGGEVTHSIPENILLTHRLGYAEGCQLLGPEGGLEKFQVAAQVSLFRPHEPTDLKLLEASVVGKTTTCN